VLDGADPDHPAATARVLSVETRASVADANGCDCRQATGAAAAVDRGPRAGVDAAIGRADRPARRRSLAARADGPAGRDPAGPVVGSRGTKRPRRLPPSPP